jgi:putative transposase
MRKSHYTEEQIFFALKQAELGTPVAEVCRKMGVSEATSFRWKQKHGGLDPSELRQLRQLEEENTTLKKLAADLSLDKAKLQDVLAKNVSNAMTRTCSAPNSRRCCRALEPGPRPLSALSADRPVRHPLRCPTWTAPVGAAARHREDRSLGLTCGRPLRTAFGSASRAGRLRSAMEFQVEAHRSDRLHMMPDLWLDHAGSARLQGAL